MIDIVFINPGDRKQIYQDLGADISAIEPPFLTASFAAYLRNKGFSVAIIDAQAENITPLETAQKARALNPLLACVIVYGNQPSASTQNMSISGRICAELKNIGIEKVVIGGLHPSALPERTLREEAVDFVIEGEEQEPLFALLESLKGFREIASVPGIWRWERDVVVHTSRSPLAKNLDEVLPIAAWDLLPMDKYRAHNWHCFDDINNRMPYAAIYTSLGCPYSCTFCCINAPFGKSGIRYRTPERVVEELELLNSKYGVKNIKFVDEMFVLDERHYMRIMDLIIEKELDLNIWCYARVDTIKEETLAIMKKAGVNWLALGIESANQDVRDGASKKMRVKDIERVVRQIQDVDIRVIGNYIFGLPDDTIETMQETLEMAIELNCEFSNFYCAMAYPGSALYTMAIKENWELPKEWKDYSQHGYAMLPLPTKYLSAKDIVRYRDDAFHKYFENPLYLDMIESKFSMGVREHIEQITKNKLKRQILE
ncbi:MAG: radical SAM protein [Sulfuricurvum sp.]|nr:radical SAM protein [Sulfuricurvum sp.]